MLKRRKKDKIKFPKGFINPVVQQAVRMWGKPKSRSWKICFTSFINANEWSSTCSRWQHAVDEKKSHKRNHESGVEWREKLFSKSYKQKNLLFFLTSSSSSSCSSMRVSNKVYDRGWRREHFNNELPMKKYVHKIWDEIMCHRHGASERNNSSKYLSTTLTVNEDSRRVNGTWKLSTWGINFITKSFILQLR